jgi:N-acetylmuramoyl-L-alanine amidase
MPYDPARPVVVIDPGDGGRDRGTIGRHEEKMFALAAALCGRILSPLIAFA